ncbi:cuticle protein 16.8-like [Tetranychus urticae]|uniref:cuticle protein 16.8-like n=1 Tax=Tetranychus urticae TaxID=32264 RepID=UPI00077BC8A8|nr:cuticle protein 16.8-like [Tetranychus urticae]
MDLTMFKLFIIFASLALATCEISQQKITGDESASSSDSQSTESSLKSSESTTSSPSPYAFSYNTADVAGNQLARQESGDNKGAVRGSYSYRDEDGLFRSVEYIADENGFRAAIRANEPGLGDSNKELLASIYHLTEATPAMVASKAAQPLLASSSKNFHYNCSNSTQSSINNQYKDCVLKLF